eukprot:3278631-Alexandrium_andersonii.AAC.1
MIAPARAMPASDTRYTTAEASGSPAEMPLHLVSHRSTRQTAREQAAREGTPSDSAPVSSHQA